MQVLKSKFQKTFKKIVKISINFRVFVWITKNIAENGHKKYFCLAKDLYEL